MENEYCKQCEDYIDFHVENTNVAGLGYMTLSCISCQVSNVVKCLSCSKVYAVSGRNHTNMRKHMGECTEQCPPVKTSLYEDYEDPPRLPIINQYLKQARINKLDLFRFI